MRIKSRLQEATVFLGNKLVSKPIISLKKHQGKLPGRQPNERRLSKERPRRASLFS